MLYVYTDTDTRSSKRQTVCSFTDSSRTCYNGNVSVLHIHIVRFITRRHPAHPVSVLILRPIEVRMKALWPQNYDTEILNRNAVKGVRVDNVMPCRYDVSVVTSVQY